MNRSDNKEELSEQPWLAAAVTELRQPLAPAVAGQLRAARRTALARQTGRTRGKPAGFRPGSAWIPWGIAAVAGLSALAVATMLLLAPLPTAGPATVQATSPVNVMLEDLSIVAGQDDLQFYEDLEFMQWLDKEGHLETQS